ncbi:MAG TPA: hypothetical protein EYQ00_08410 [Dehalococcoidia bacterium]|jgi:hypothetical protein|nr:hypothetical protein [Dehalococcoidia bacterium]
MLDYEKGDLVYYASRIDGTSHITGLVIDVEYLTKADDFLVYILWANSDSPGRPQALYQQDCHSRDIRTLSI